MHLEGGDSPSNLASTWSGDARLTPEGEVAGITEDKSQLMSSTMSQACNSPSEPASSL